MTLPRPIAIIPDNQCVVDALTNMATIYANTYNNNNMADQYINYARTIAEWEQNLTWGAPPFADNVTYNFVMDFLALDRLKHRYNWLGLNAILPSVYDNNDVPNVLSNLTTRERIDVALRVIDYYLSERVPTNDDSSDARFMASYNSRNLGNYRSEYKFIHNKLTSHRELYAAE
jgi:hypothetical protein